MRFPVNTSVLRFTVVGAPEPAHRRKRNPARAHTRTPAAEDGERWRVRLRIAGAGFEQIVRASVPGNPRLEPGTPVALDDLTLVTWERPGGCGYALRARTITPYPDAAPRERP
jgi:hypothetical protein